MLLISNIFKWMVLETAVDENGGHRMVLFPLNTIDVSCIAIDNKVDDQCIVKTSA